MASFLVHTDWLDRKYYKISFCNASNSSFHAIDLFLYPLKTSENQSFLNVFWKYRKRPVARNELTRFRPVLRFV